MKTRIYHPDGVSCGAQLQLSAPSSRHLLQVLRKGIGSSIEIFDGQGQAFHAEIVSTDNKRATVEIIAAVASIAESCLSIHLGQAISRGDRMDYAVQKAVELGVRSITPLYTQNVQVKYDQNRIQKKLDHWHGIIVHAAQQCGRSYLPLLNPPLLLAAWIQQQKNIFICELGEHNKSKKLLDPAEVSVCIGPEGGWADHELDNYWLEDNVFALPLGPRILRTETAVPAALALLQSRWGDMAWA
jgi:16S rRNA (uracil1498-N3)-methyltransferase